MKRIYVNLPDELAARVAGIATETGAPAAEVIRRALRNNLFMDIMTPDQRKQATRQPVLFTNPEVK